MKYLAVRLQETRAISRDERVEFHMFGFLLCVVGHLFLAGGHQLFKVILQALHLFASTGTIRAKCCQVLNAILFNLLSRMQNSVYFDTYKEG